MDFVETVEALEERYGQAGEASHLKVAPHITPSYRAWIERSRLCILSTVGPDGTDASPRGDDGPVVRELDPATLAIPDWRGNNRMDSLRNIVVDPRVSLMFVIKGSHNVIRVNGEAKITVDETLCESFAHQGHVPRSVIIVKVREVYSQCARALMRARIWDGEDQAQGLPTMGDILREQSQEVFDGARYDREWGARAEKTMW
ncbi:pyridoxamine 5'-phosphate oxidase family protein [Falsihalocynthiibacter sp. SS001]|uniref:pyridoxamine 5'-phosphate oxidase family protein n=1 Tax=Falsihalocynthiibacter sp. SS001 TaxID=3349698 RepID=UPI0036D413B1